MPLQTLQQQNVLYKLPQVLSLAPGQHPLATLAVLFAGDAEA